MGACDIWNVEINILVYENETSELVSYLPLQR